MSDSITRYQHEQIAEQSIANFIKFLESESEEPVADADKEWLFKKGREIFESYYIDNRIMVKLITKEEKDSLQNYFGEIQECLGRMFSHIMLLEFKLYLLTKGLDI